MSSPSIGIFSRVDRLLNERADSCAKIDPVDVRSRSQHTDVLADGPFLDSFAQPLSDLIAHDIEWQLLTCDASIDRHDMKAKASFDDVTQ